MKKLKLLGLTMATFFAWNTHVSALEVSNETELKACVSKTEEICTLHDNIQLSQNLLIPTDSKITLELNEKTLDVASFTNNYGITVKGDFTITGKGTVNVGKYGIGTSTSGGNLTIKGGTFHSIDGDYLIGVFGGTTIIEDGTFDGNYCVINAFVEYTGTAIVNGGTFSVSKEAVNGYEPYIVLGNTTVNAGVFDKEVTDYLAEGKSSKMIDDLYYVGEIHSIVVSEVENGKVTINETAITGESVTFTVKANTGYEVKNIVVTNADNQEIEMKDNQFVMPNSMVTINVEFVPIEYTVLEGNNQQIEINAQKGITFRIDADYNLFEKLYLDGKEVSKENYTTKSGSTIITLNANFAKTLSTGKHEIKAIFTNGGSATTEFSLVSNAENPNTSDNIIIYFMLGIISIIGLGLFNVKFYMINMSKNY